MRPESKVTWTTSRKAPLSRLCNSHQLLFDKKTFFEAPQWSLCSWKDVATCRCCVQLALSEDEIPLDPMSENVEVDP